MTERKKVHEIIKPADPVGETTRRKARAAASAANGFPWTLVSITDAVREHAYYIWENEGRPEGRDFEIWIRAEKESLSRIINPSTALRTFGPSTSPAKSQKSAQG